MSRFWMVQQILSAAGLILGVSLGGSWLAAIFGAVGFLLTGWQFMRACERDDARRPPVIVTDRQL